MNKLAGDCAAADDWGARPRRAAVFMVQDMTRRAGNGYSQVPPVLRSAARAALYRRLRGSRASLWPA